MDLISTIFDKNANIIKEAFSHITKYSNGEVIITDEKLNIIFQNSKYNFKKGKFDISVLAFEDRKQKLKKSFENFQKTDKKHIFLKLIFKNDVQNIPMDIHICKIFNKKNKVKGYSIILQDITQEIKNRIQKETFIDILTHDLKNPMRANIQILELVLNGKFGKLDNNLKSILDELLNSCKFMNYMTDNLLIKYKNEFSLNELQKQTYSIIELIKDKAHELSKVLERKKQTIELVINGNIDDVEIDIDEIGKVISNLIINASEQSIENSKIIIQIEKSNNNINISFFDFGYPQNNHNPNEIFEEYITCSNKFRKIGFGLNLYNCRKIVEAHYGKIWAKNIENIGTMISFCLPT